MKRTGIVFIWLAGISAAIAGCASPSQIMALKDLGDSQSEMAEYVKRQEKSFDKLRQDLEDGRLAKGLPKDKIISLYDEPIFCEPKEKDNSRKEACLYRRPLDFFASDKICLTFDERGKLESWELIKHKE